jgi:hypothetical protein
VTLHLARNDPVPVAAPGSSVCRCAGPGDDDDDDELPIGDPPDDDWDDDEDDEDDDEEPLQAWCGAASPSGPHHGTMAPLTTLTPRS